MNKLKKVIAASLLIGCTFISTNMVFGSEFIYGDVNEDKVVNSDDYAILRKHVNKVLIPVENRGFIRGYSDRRSYFNRRTYTVFQLTSEYSLKAADVNADGLIDATDCAVIRAYILGKSTSLPSDIT